MSEARAARRLDRLDLGERGQRFEKGGQPIRRHRGRHAPRVPGARGRRDDVHPLQEIHGARGNLVRGQDHADRDLVCRGRDGRGHLGQHLVVRGERTQPRHEGEPAHGVLGIGRQAHAVAVDGEHVQHLGARGGERGPPVGIEGLARDGDQVALPARAEGRRSGRLLAGPEGPAGQAQLGPACGSMRQSGSQHEGG